MRRERDAMAVSCDMMMKIGEKLHPFADYAV